MLSYATLKANIYHWQTFSIYLKKFLVELENTRVKGAEGRKAFDLQHQLISPTPSPSPVSTLTAR